MSMSQQPDDIVVEIPARIAELGFRISVPRGWQVIGLPAGDVEFHSSAQFIPLMMAAATSAGVMLTVAARPGFPDGNLQDWSLALLEAQGIDGVSVGLAEIGNVRGLTGVGRQEGARSEFKFAFFEDGGRPVFCLPSGKLSVIPRGTRHTKSPVFTLIAVSCPHGGC